MAVLSEMILTDEQNEVKDVILSDISCVVNACPGAGKTTLSLVITQLYNKKTLVLTFSSKLKDETRDKVSKNNIKNCIVHSYNSAPRDHYLNDAYNDEDIYEILSRDIEPFEKIDYEFIVLDEIQDMTKAHYKYLMKFIKDMDIKPVFLIIGDVDQSIFQFKGADSRYLTMCDQLEFQGEFVKKTLTKTFRLTKHMVSFINEAVYGYTKYTSLSAIKDPKPVTYVKCDSYDDEGLFKFLVDKIKGYDVNEVYILAPSIVSNKIPIKNLENYIVDYHKQIKIHIPKSDNDYTNDEVSRNKIVMTNYHKVKGSEKQLVIVFGF
jgi:superfamily I DNA/RNA helicase